MTDEPATADVRRVLERFPEVQRIQDKELRDRTIRVLCNAPDYFWEVPATATDKYHNPLTRGEHGLWIHTKMAFTAFERISASWVEMGFITEEEQDYGRAAVLVHDMLKNGKPLSAPDCDVDSNRDGSVDHHDVLMADFLRERTDMPEEVAQAVEVHMGPWYEGESPSEYVPDSFLGLLVHTCDMVASTANITPGVYEASEELQEKYANLPNAHFTDG